MLCAHALLFAVAVLGAVIEVDSRTPGRSGEKGEKVGRIRDLGEVEQRLEGNLGGGQRAWGGVGAGRVSERAEVRVQPSWMEMKCLITSSRGGTGNRCGGQRLREGASPLESRGSSDGGKVGRLLAKRSADTSRSRRRGGPFQLMFSRRGGRVTVAHAPSVRPSLTAAATASHSDEDKRLNLILPGGF